MIQKIETFVYTCDRCDTKTTNTGVESETPSKWHNVKTYDDKSYRIYEELLCPKCYKKYLKEDFK